jgi:hypothetical protein
MEDIQMEIKEIGLVVVVWFHPIQGKDTELAGCLKTNTAVLSNEVAVSILGRN